MTTPSRRTCVHEAGHAVMALLLGAKIESVSVVPREGSRGRTIADAPTTFGDCMIAAAGSVAECIEFEYDDNARDEDRGLVHHLTGGIPYEEYQCAARWMLSMHWTAVQRVADALLSWYVMSGHDLRVCVGELRPNMFERMK